MSRRQLTGVRLRVEQLDLRDDTGALGVGAIALGILTFAMGALLMANAWAVIDARVAVTSAAREGVRAFVVSPDESSAEANMHTAIDQTLVGYGRDPSSSDVPTVTGDFARCEWITVRVTYDVPTIVLGGLGNWGTITTTGEYTEIMDPYRSGLEVPDDPDDVEGAGECVP